MIKTKTYKMAAVGLMAALICILGPVVIMLPFTPIPISLATLVLYLSAFVLGYRLATISCLIYLLLGLVGLPVFSGFAGGAGKLFGPTGGYLIGYLLVVYVSGYFIEKFYKMWYFHLIGMALATAILYLFGTVWLACCADMTFAEAFMAGVIPFIPGDIVKIVIILFVGPMIRKRLYKAGVY
ncbi:MAG: biotin transporter BioY [Lachnospiraceae bacterium]|nr:biotin transporter BioY [Lachnospiraceae bacterium]